MVIISFPISVYYNVVFLGVFYICTIHLLLLTRGSLAATRGTLRFVGK